MKPSLCFIGGSLKSAVGYTHYLACQESWHLKAGCYSTSENINQMTAEKYGTRYYTSWRDMLRKESPDAVVVLTPTPSHAKIILPLIEYGIPIICEKELAESSKDVRAIIKALFSFGGWLAITYNYSGYPMIRELRYMIERNELGKILHFQAEMPQESYCRIEALANPPQKWRLNDGNVPMIYLDLFSHLHHLIHYTIRENPEEVIVNQNRYGMFDVIDNVSCLCKYSHNIDGQIWFSKSAVGHRNGLRLRIYGEKRSAEWYQMNPEELFISSIDGSRLIKDRSISEVGGRGRYSRFKPGHPAGFIEAFANLYHDIASVKNDDVVQEINNPSNYRSEVYGAGLALKGLEMMEAMARSVESKKWEVV